MREWVTTLILLIIASALATAQTIPATGYNRDSLVIAKRVQSLPEQRDIGDIFRNLFNIKTSSTADSMLEKPGKLFFSFAPAAGYTLEGGPTAVVVVNSSFYTSDPKNTTCLCLHLVGNTHLPIS